jgi:hypothetical protein
MLFVHELVCTLATLDFRFDSEVVYYNDIIWSGIMINGRLRCIGSSQHLKTNNNSKDWDGQPLIVDSLMLYHLL